VISWVRDSAPVCSTKVVQDRGGAGVQADLDRDRRLGGAATDS
jgi:hypothetical protein